MKNGLFYFKKIPYANNNLLAKFIVIFLKKKLKITYWRLIDVDELSSDNKTWWFVRKFKYENEENIEIIAKELKEYLISWKFVNEFDYEIILKYDHDKLTNSYNKSIKIINLNNKCEKK